MPEPAPAAAAAPAPPLRAALQSLGCRLNHAESDLLRQRLLAAGYALVPWGEPAEVAIVNSCTVTVQADADTRQALRQARRAHPQARVAVVGCAAQVGAATWTHAGLADLVLGTADKLSAVERLGRMLPGAPPVVAVARPPRTPFTLDWNGLPEPAEGAPASLTRAHLKVQDGCDFMCSFCIIPQARGRGRSRALEDLVAEAEARAAGGALEIVLTGVNLGTYAERGASLLEVVDRLDAIPGLARIRISSIEPTTVPVGLLERMVQPGRKLVPFLHLPLQSGADRVLQAMRRRYRRDQYAQFAQRALQQVPDLCLGTDVLVGYPGEEDADFAETLALARDLPFAYLHVFTYSARPGTTAATRVDTVPGQTIRRRAALLRALSEDKRRAFHRLHVGRVLPVLMERPRAATLAEGYTANYIRVRVPCADAFRLRNRIVPVRLLEAGGAAMSGELAGDSA
ncbi:MAG TPA: tRNA (N(6)-L-threonylcarbamoyladenosine(37)-C(2))-methylthiotransferase MtaB [bacterium]|nr:tRNA (N(6)-L-threonylcarbamoyladenosine(37)-C(2))-methylthiotransferase MtaB [bacterium]